MKRYTFLSNILVSLGFIAILIVAFLLRSRMFLYGDFYLLADQGRDLQLAKEIVVGHKLTLIGGHAGFGGIFHGPLWWYMITPFFALSHGNPFFTLVPLYLIVSLGIIVVAFFIGKSLYGKYTGLFFAFLLTISHFFVSTIYFTSNAQVMPLVFLPYMYCAIQYLRKKDNFLIGVFFFMGLGVNFEAAFAITLIPLTIMAILFRRRMPSIKLFVLSFIAFIIPVSTYILFDIRHQFLMTKSVIRLLTGHYSLASSDAGLNNIVFRFHDRLNSLLSLINFPLFIEESMGRYYVYVLFSLVAIVSFAQILKKKAKHAQENTELLFIFLIPIVIYICYMFVKIPLQGHYTMSLGISIILLVVLAARKIAQYNLGLGIILTTIFIVYEFLPVLDTIQSNYLIKTAYATDSNGSYINEMKAVDSIFKNANGEKFGYFVFDLPVVTYGMDYLMWWRGSTKYHYIPVSQKLPTTYLILNPAYASDVHAHDFWIRHTVRTSAPVLKKWVSTGDITIEKLSISNEEQPADPNYYQNLIFR